MNFLSYETNRLVEIMSNMGEIPTIHGTELLVFEDMDDELINYISRFSVLKNHENIRQILQWKYNMMLGKKDDKEKTKDGIPLSGLKIESSNKLYNFIFDQKNTLLNLKEPIKIILFRSGESGKHLINILKKSQNINISILLNPTDDSKSWYYAAREFNAPGIPSAGKALIALAKDNQVRELLTTRIRTTEQILHNVDHHYFNFFLQQLENPADKIQLLPCFRKAFDAAMKISSNKRELINEYLKAFWDEFMKRIEKNPNIIFPFNNIPLRSLVILGAYYFKKNTENQKTPSWQEVLDEIGEKILDIRKGNNVFFVTEQRQFLIGAHEDGVICFSESAIKKFSNIGYFYGIWLVDEKTDEEYIEKFKKVLSEHKVEIESNWELNVNEEIEEKEIFKKTVLKINKEHLNIVAGILNNRCTCLNNNDKKKQNRTFTRVKDHLENADLIIYPDEYIETSVGGALIVPGVREAIEKVHSNNYKLKISLRNEKNLKNLTELNLFPNIDKIYRYATGKMKYNYDDHNWKNANNYFDYILNLVENEDEETINVTFNEQKQNRIFEQYINTEKFPKFGFFPSKALSEAIISIAGINRAGFIIDKDFGLILKKYIPENLNSENLFTSAIGLFKNDKTKLLVINVRNAIYYISKDGGFVFDIDMTLLPKNAYVFTDYPELANIFMKLLRNQHNLAIISGNSEEEQIPRIEGPLKREMDNDYSSLKNLIFYVNGGATKIHYNENGKKINDTEDNYNIKNAMDYEELKKAVNSALMELNSNEFYLSNDEKKLYIEEAKNKYPDLNLKVSWEHQSWEPLWITPTQLNGFKSDKKLIYFPWIEIRGKRADDDKIASIAIKPSPEIKKDDELRILIQNTIRSKLGDSSNEYHLRSGGSTTTDITKVNADKVAALKDFITRKNLQHKYIYYFGDEFYKNGNDQVIADHADLQETNTIAVNSGDNKKIPIGKTTWIGRSPQAVLEFLERIVPS